ncbi:hypothetical protein SISNIDRAFT_488362 [Sistotremastrum niveocremeum HHB9708]|uniref:Uncharacterized protein n=1 Tax=Sistotremastrum niveocremeum HHB9708 TaxID=1314777 RepID=A0A164REM9_9AGAM|nr:hypothetical protein SISNIDRAFT_488362 [Sistotremastrum niveocremeum HHB9708]
MVDVALVSPGRTITKTNLTSQYHLGSNEVSRLNFAPRQSSSSPGRIMHLYRESEVEQLAWTVNGGKQGFINRLKTLKILYHWTDRGKQFPCPIVYAGLIRNATMPDWLWKIGYAQLDRMRGQFVRRKMMIMSLASTHVEDPYPEKPERRHAPSPSFDQLRELLEVVQLDGEDGVFDALNDVIAEHGKAGWMDARWEVYNTLYQEDEVEQVAWKKHGGQQGFITLLRELKILYCYTYPKNYFPAICPSEYAPFVENYWMPGWIWSICYEQMEELIESEELEDTDSKRRGMVRSLAHYYVSSPYPRRPRKATGSTSFKKLRSLFEWAPTLEDTVNPTQYTPYQLVDCEEERGSTQWSNDYLAELFTAMKAIIAEHGEGDDGWGAARWEVYDLASSAFLSGLRYDTQKNQWHDHARFWLDTPSLKVYLAAASTANSE